MRNVCKVHFEYKTLKFMFTVWSHVYSAILTVIKK